MHSIFATRIILHIGQTYRTQQDMVTITRNGAIPVTDAEIVSDVYLDTVDGL